MAKQSGKSAGGRGSGAAQSERRTRLSQTDVPGVSLEQALRVPRAIVEHYAGRPTSPLRVASGMRVQPNAGPFRTVCGAAIAYGLTTGGPNADEIALTPLGSRAVRPLAEGDDESARREALLNPRVVGEFLRRYDGHPVPREDIARNVLTDMGVPTDRTKDVFEMILEGARSVGYVHEIKGKPYVDLQGASSSEGNDTLDGNRDVDAEQGEDVEDDDSIHDATVDPKSLGGQDAARSSANRSSRRVFITHGKNTAFVEPVKKLLGFGEMEAVVSTEKQSVSQPVPDKVIKDMRSCGAAIIHVEAERRLMDEEAKEHVVLNPNVLIEIGAAMALYGRRFILLVRDGVQLPSNLQGLYEVRYTGDVLSGEATIKLLEAINDIKNHPLPERYEN